METRDRSSYPDSARPGDGKSSDWIAKPYSIVFTGIVLFIFIFGIAILLSYRQFETTRHSALANDKTTANLLADLILEHNKATIGILQSYANRPLFINAVKNKDLPGVDRHLSDLEKNTEIDITFVSDKNGILWANFPVFLESRGKDFSQLDWYQGISALWKPYISTVFKRIVGDKALAVTVCVPIFDEKERVIGILGNSQRLGFLDDTIEKVAFSPYTTLSVIDRAGKILYSNKFPYRENITDYQSFSIVEPAIKGKKQQIEINDPQEDQEKSYITVVPIGDIGWTVIIERSRRDIYRSDLKRFIEIGVVSFLLFLLIIFFLVYLRRATLFRKTEELLQAEIKLRQGDEKLLALSSRHEAIMAAVPEIIMEVDSNKVYTWANSVGIEFFGEDVIGKEAAFYFEGEQETYDSVSPLFSGAKEIIYVESWQRRRDGQKRLLAWWCRVLEDEKGNVEGALSSAYDITERKRTEEALKASEAQYRWLSEHITDSVWLLDMNLKPTYQSPSMEKLTGFTHEELMELPLEKRITPESLKLALELFLELMPRIMADSDYNPHRTLELEYYCKDGTILWTENKLSGIRDENGKPLSILAEVRDITDRKRAEEELQQTLDSLRKAVGMTIQVMVSAVEARDPYTAGHQLRSADLARAIATEMGLPQEKIDAIRMAGSIHDIGKLSIPAEILSKPTKLSEIEFSLIKEHARKGFDMLKDVESPWPLAEIVYQHHERMDGSGYPRHLKGDDILIEARILNVADVVEAMASHRPYRPGLGIDAALTEIEKNRGTFYDDAVADACLRLFREKGFKLEGT